MTRILVYTPSYLTGDGQPAIMPETVASIEALAFDGAWDWELSTVNPYGTDRKGDNVTAQYQRARRLVLEKGYDALLTIEHDMIVPSHALQTLWDDGGDVVYAVYVLRHGTNSINAFQFTGGRNIGMSLDSHPEELARAKAAGRWRVSGVSNGCTLIRRHVLEALDFRSVGGGPPDIEFAYDALAAGFESYARFDVLCGHYCELMGGWLWPFKDNNVTDIDVIANVTLTTPLGRLKAGEQATLPAKLARDLERAGYVRRVEVEEPEPEPKAKPTRKRGSK